MTNFKIPKNGNSMMPFNFGPRDTDPRSSGWYRDVSMLIIPYKTDAEMLRKLIPEQFKISDEPTVSVNYARNKDIDWLAGRNYNLISVSVEAIFSGDVDEVTASYNLVMWENLTDPILTGREMQGYLHPNTICLLRAVVLVVANQSSHLATKMDKAVEL